MTSEEKEELSQLATVGILDDEDSDDLSDRIIQERVELENRQKEERRGLRAQRSFQFKGAHDKSYFDLSQLRIRSRHKSPSRMSPSRSSSSRVLLNEDASIDDFDSIDDSEDSSKTSSEPSTVIEYDIHKSRYKRAGQFSTLVESPLIFQGRYRAQSISDTFLPQMKPVDFDISADVEPSPDYMRAGERSRWKYIVESQTIKKGIKNRGYYSENISPLLRPEKILAARQKELDELRRYAIEAEGEYEREGEVVKETEESGEDERRKKDIVIDWPPIYKVLNPEPALAELELPVTYKEASLMARGSKPGYAPHLKRVPYAAPTSNILQPDENWVIYETEPNVAFPVKAFKPRCYILHVVDPETLPRKVFVERRRRQYLSQNIDELLARYGLTDDDLLPPSSSKSEDQYSLYGSASFLPLEAFDDVQFDPCSVEDWLALGYIDGIQHPIPAVGFLPMSSLKLSKLNIGRSSMRYTSLENRKQMNAVKEKKLQEGTSQIQYLWTDVAVTHFNSKLNKWAILTLDGSKTKMYLPRIYLMFRAEDPLNFTLRVKDAVKRRKLAEKLIKFNIYCDCMPLCGLPEIDQTTMNRINRKVTRNGVFKGTEEILNELEEDVQVAHKRRLAEMSLVRMVTKYPEMFSFVSIPPPDEMTVPVKCLATTGMEDFQGIRRKVKKWWLYVIDETYLGMKQVVLSCLGILSLNFFTASYGKHITLDEFENIQTSFTRNLMKYLRKEWVEVVITNVRMCLQDVGKGWFNIKEKSWPIYESSKLSRYMDLIKFRMQTSLKYLVENSTDLLLKIIETPCQVCHEVPNDGFVWGSDIINSKFKPSTAPIFTLGLKIGPTEPYYTTNPDSFEDVFIKLFDNAIVSSHSVDQIHPFLLLNLRFPQLFLSSIGLMDPLVTGKRERIRASIKKAVIPLKAYAKEYQKYVQIYNTNVNEFIAAFASRNYSSNEIKDEIEMHLEEKNILQAEIPNSIVIGPFNVATEFVRNHLVEKKQEIVDKLLLYLADRLKVQVTEILEEFENLMNKMLEKPTSIENIFEIKEWLETVPTAVKGYEETIKRIILDYEILDSFWYSLENEDFDNKIALLGWPYKITIQIDETLEMLAMETERFYRIQQSDEANLWSVYEWCIAEVQNLMQISDIKKVHEVAVQTKKIWKAMKDNQELAALLTSRQKLFGVPLTSFDLLFRLVKDFTPYKDLWITASDWGKYYEIWMDNPLSTIDGEGIERTHNDMLKVMQKCQRIFAEIPANYQIATTIKNEIDEFRPYIPLIVALKSPGLKDRHWEQIARETGCRIKNTPTLTFKECLAAGLKDHGEILVRIAETATKEHSIELALDEMEKDWDTVELDLQPYKETGTYIIKIPDEIIQMLEDHIVTTQQFSFSPFKGMFEQKIDEWEAKLRLISAVFDEWMECQKQWMYLEPIFSSEDITEQLPQESKKYNTMERTWRRIMKNGLDLPKVIWYCPDKRLLESLKECNFLLEQVQKGLADYLEAKRTIFPRLYFLSDDELLEILAQARNPLAVQPHLRKCFENIYKLYFESDLKITKMFSAEGECVNLIEPMYPKGNVEYWLYMVEEAMKTTVRVTLGQALINLTQIDRNKWVLSWPGQIVIAGCQTYWTAHVEEALLQNSLFQYYQLMLTHLDGLRSLVKGPLKRVERQILSALIVIEVHARDVTQQIYENQVKNVNDFDWISQLRYYWVKDTDLKVRAVNAEFQYGYEYLGNSGRLVITPLTDRCYLTLTGALHLKFGGAPAGPAGTGKTETTKDLAKAMAIQCVVFNCSDQLDFMAMGKFFKGLASSGAWACFDEFNRIDIEVLSVIAQQVVTIQKAQIQRLDRFMFEGVEISLKPSCAVFITMNPGYAGRTELPDNLKALFRPVAMMVPNYTLIAEISLFSFGFSDAKELAGKITTTFKLSSEQLSSQDHYDFGMRAVKTVIAVAGNLKRERPTMDERQIVLRALRDVNVPKFLRDDLKLFNGIVSDLFPRMVEEAIDYGDLEESIRFCINNVILEDVDEYVKKVIQLYETTVVRHGLMLVGPTGSGKTKCYEILKAAMTRLQGKPSPSGYPFEMVHTYVLNPKSITMGQLYGEFDLLTHEWTDGILPSLVRIGTASENLDKHWYVFDGPVDAVWIENMNTVLDDNKKLCLTSGEIIKLTEAQTMMFEVADLAVASPATVSRCGMVYLEPSVLGLSPFVNCWFRRIPKAGESLVPKLSEAFDKFLFPAIELLRTSLREIVASIDSSIVFTFLHHMDIRIRPLTNPDGKPLPPKPFLATLPNLVVPFVVYSLIWSVGATCDNASRVIFSNWLREKMVEHEAHPLIPDEGLVYDYRFHDGGFSDPIEETDPIPPYWIHWMADTEPYIVSPDMKYSDIEVPTIDTVRNAWQLGLLLNNYNNVLCVGPTGTGKTLTIAAKLGRGMHKKFISDFIVFSARTSANQTQDLIDSKLDKRRRNVYGPPVSKRQIFFIDDLNMPALETYGAQPPIELIRQWMDFGGWYDRKEIGTFRSIIDTNFVAAMGPPGGGRNPITARLMRHFNYIAFTELEDDSKMTIFGAIVESWMSRTSGLGHMTDQFVKETMKVYAILLTEMLPTPAKTHYTFNLRDLSKVFQGVLMVEPETIDSKEKLLNLWYHENCRVFQDRLVNNIDRDWFDNLMKDFIENKFGVNTSKVLDTEIIIYADCCSDSKNYERITDFQRLQHVLEEGLEDYNTRTTAPMKLVLFLDALSHICRVSRVIRQPLGNALLLGVGGSGRQSLSKLAAHVSELFFFQIELTKSYGLNDWRDDVKTLMIRSGMENRETVFLFSDTQIKMESFVEDLNSILNSGDVPNIYASDELDKIYGAMRGAVQEAGLIPTKSNLFATYCRSVRSNLHCVLSMSPIGEVFRARLRQFPALVNCCTIDWFFPWPDSALESVGRRFLSDVSDLEVDEEILTGIVSTCQFMHQSVVVMSQRYLTELSRYNYVTPTLYLELLASYSLLLKKKKWQLIQAIKRLKTGLDKMQSTAEEVKVLEKELFILKPDLEKAAKEAAEMIEKIAADTAVAEETKAKVAADEATATKVKEEAQAISEDAQKDLEEALPALEAAEKSLQALNKGDIGEVKALKTPPSGVITVIEAICIIKGIPPKRVLVPGPIFGTKVNDYWEPGKKMMADAGQFLASLLNFDKDSITEDMIIKLEKYINDPNFQPAKIIKVSKACTSLCMWAHAMYKFYFINKVVAPKKAALKEANDRLAAVQKVLDVAKAKMTEILRGLAKLESKLKETERNKAILEANAKLCEDRMDRAFRLINGLADEKERWINTVEKYNEGLSNVVGDVLISAGSIAYLAPFTDQFRRRLLNMWVGRIAHYKIPHTPKCDPVSTLGDPILIRQWQIYGLPRDFLSIENGVLVANSKRWPLFIDPQGQANRWIRNMGKEHGMTVAKLSDKDLVRTLEASIRFGKPCLIENVGLDLDPALDSVLLRQVFKQAGTLVLKLGDTVVPYNDDFRLYLTTKLANPHYTPEVSIKVLLVNFALVPSGLQDQLLALVVMQERPDLEEARSMIVVSSAQMSQELSEIEDRILYKLSTSEGSPVDDIDLIQTLEASKLKSEEIKQKVKAAETTQIEIDNTRALYIPVANRAQILFFCLVDMSNVDPMYQYSMDWFVNIFINSMANTEKTGEIATRIVTINDYFTFSLYANVCRSLFEKHKLLFAFLLCIRILMDKGVIDHEEYQFLLAGGVPKGTYPNPAPKWISERSWIDISSLDNLPAFASLVQTFPERVEGFKKIFDSTEPHRTAYPKPYDTTLNEFQKIIFLKCIRPDKVTNAMQDFLALKLGQIFIEPVTSDLQAMYKESTPFTPLIFVLSAGTDPAAELYKFADRMKMSKRFETISLGQGQGPIAEKMMTTALESGSWVYFQNCHLAPSWMPRLERLIENINPDSVHKEFRLWLTSTPSPYFPVAILQNGSKMTVEPPRGIKANLLKAYLNQVTEFNDFFHSEAERVPLFKWLLFSLCLFHGVCLERRKFGPLGFNIPYEFTDGDLRICISQLHMFLLEYHDIPFKVLTYTAGQINYGGRVTDDWDRRCIMNMLSDYYHIKVCDPQYRFDEMGVYHQLPKETTLAEYLAYIKGLPLNDDPSLFGLHSNADISCAQAETFKTLNTLLSLQPKVSGGESASQEEVTSKLANSVLSKIPKPIDLEFAQEKYPVLYEESLNTVLVQEIIRYNKLLNVIQSTLKDLLKALKGLVVMSAKLEEMSLSMFNQRVPGAWSSKAYPSLKPLGAWVDDLVRRVQFLQKWIDHGIPPAFWISGFYFPQAFLTGTLQNFARKYIISIDSIFFSFQILKQPPTSRPDDGCCIYGLFIEGARFDREIGLLAESKPKELYTEMPYIWLIPKEHYTLPSSGIYECPVYKTLTRAGTLSTTGHSTNYVLAIAVPTDKSQSHWIRRGVALFCALDY